MNIQVVGNVPVLYSKPLVEIDEGETQARGKPRARCSLARPSGTDETNHIVLHLFSSAYLLFNPTWIKRLQGVTKMGTTA